MDLFLADAVGERGSGDARRFSPQDGGWLLPPVPWRVENGLSSDLRAAIERAVAGLPPLHRRVVCMRDVDGMTAADVSAALALSPVHQIALLHRARTEIRRALDRRLRAV